jgi:hypothetical protein
MKPNEPPTYVLLDTCSYSNLIQGTWSKDSLSSFQALINAGAKAEISDLTFVELLSGKKSLADARSLALSLLANGFGVYGHSKDLRDIGEGNVIFRLKDDASFDAYKRKLIQIRNDFLQPVFAQLFIDYMRLFSLILGLTDKDYWGILFSLFQHAQKKAVVDYIDFTYKDYLTNPKEKNNVLLLSSLTLAYLLLKGNAPSLTFEDFTSKTKWGDTPNGLSKLTRCAIDNFKKMGPSTDPEIKKINSMGTLDFLMYIQHKNAPIYDDQSNLEFYAINYVAINAGFCPGKLQFNDLTDLSNFSVSGDKSTEFVYFTDEKRWNEFRRYVSRTTPDLLSKANQFRING